MRSMGLRVAMVAAVLVTAAPTLAAENFIPLGHPYAPGDDRLPFLNSGRDRLNGQTDVYESEIFRDQRERKIFETQLSRHIYFDLSAEPVLTPDY